MNISDIIEKYAKNEIFIEVLADAYDSEVGICWRGYVTWKEGGRWLKEDCGCTADWLKSFNLGLTFINEYFEHGKRR